MQEVGMLKMADISHFMLRLFQFRIYCDSPDVKPMIREERSPFVSFFHFRIFHKSAKINKVTQTFKGHLFATHKI